MCDQAQAPKFKMAKKIMIFCNMFERGIPCLHLSVRVSKKVFCISMKILIKFPENNAVKVLGWHIFLPIFYHCNCSFIWPLHSYIYMQKKGNTVSALLDQLQRSKGRFCALKPICLLNTLQLPRPTMPHNGFNPLCLPCPCSPDLQSEKLLIAIKNYANEVF